MLWTDNPLTIVKYWRIQARFGLDKGITVVEF